VKVSIDAGGRSVEVETGSDQNVTSETVSEVALKLWRATESASGSRAAGLAFGLTQEHDHGGRQVGTMHWPVAPVRAETET
jgi:hypothetical protein